MNYAYLFGFHYVHTMHSALILNNEPFNSIDKKEFFKSRSIQIF